MALENEGKKIVCWNEDPLPQKYEFLDRGHRFQKPKAGMKFDCVIATDAASFERLGTVGQCITKRRLFGLVSASAVIGSMAVARRDGMYPASTAVAIKMAANATKTPASVDAMPSSPVSISRALIEAWNGAPLPGHW